MRVVLTLLVALLAGGLAGSAAARPDEASTRPSVTIRLQWDGYSDGAELLATPEGPRYRLSRTDGSSETLTPEEFARIQAADTAMWARVTRAAGMEPE